MHAGDQFGYDAVVGEFHDSTVRCVEPSEVLSQQRRIAELLRAGGAPREKTKSSALINFVANFRSVIME